MQGSLFFEPGKQPLAERMRPHSLDEFWGQNEVVGKGKFLRRMIEKDSVPSLLFYGPPGTGKTTLAHIIAKQSGDYFEPINAVAAGVVELRKLINQARDRQMAEGRRTILFIDESHRFNKAQQDVLLPYVERGVVTMIGATTENPFFEVNSPLLSRLKLIRLNPLTNDEIIRILHHAVSDKEHGLGNEPFTVEESALETMAEWAGGDARKALNLLEQAASMLDDEGDRALTPLLLKSLLAEAGRMYDKKGDQHYDVVSAFIKSMRGSDPDAALHYLARMIEGGEDPVFIIRRVVICAAEDVGNADPQALILATAAMQAVQLIGWPEARIPLAQAVCYIAAAPKSNAAYQGIEMAQRDVRQKNCGAVPMHLRDAHYPGAEKLNHGVMYQYPHAFAGNYVKQQYLPDALVDAAYYEPTDNGQEAAIKKRLDQLKEQNRCK